MKTAVLSPVIATTSQPHATFQFHSTPEDSPNFTSELRHEAFQKRREAMMHRIQTSLLATSPHKTHRLTVSFHDLPTDCLRVVFEFLGGMPHVHNNGDPVWLTNRFSFASSLNDLGRPLKQDQPTSVSISMDNLSSIMRIVDNHFGSESKMRQFFESTLAANHDDSAATHSPDLESRSQVALDQYLGFALISYQCYLVYRSNAPIYLLLRNGFSNREHIYQRLTRLRSQCATPQWCYELAFLIMDNQVECVDFMLNHPNLSAQAAPHFWSAAFFTSAMDSCAFESIQSMCLAVSKPHHFSNPKHIYIQWYKDISAQIKMLTRTPSKNYDLVVQLGKMRFSFSQLQDRNVRRAFQMVIKETMPDGCGDLSELRSGHIPQMILSFDFQNLTRELIMRLEMLCFVDASWGETGASHWNRIEQCIAHWIWEIVDSWHLRERIRRQKRSIERWKQMIRNVAPILG